jgi:nitroreductase
MRFIDIVRQRRSVRKYSDKPVSRADIEKCLEAARLAPSAQNSQPWNFIIISGRARVEEFGKKVFTGIYSPTSFARKASAIVVMLSRPGFITNVVGKQIQDIPFWLLDMGIAGEHLVLQAQELGIGTCWIGWFDGKAVKKHLSLPPGLKVAGLIAMGYPEQKSESGNRKRRTLKDIVYQWIE